MGKSRLRGIRTGTVKRVVPYTGLYPWMTTIHYIPIFLKCARSLLDGTQSCYSIKTDIIFLSQLALLLFEWNEKIFSSSGKKRWCQLLWSRVPLFRRYSRLSRHQTWNEVRRVSPSTSSHSTRALVKIALAKCKRKENPLGYSNSQSQPFVSSSLVVTVKDNPFDNSWLK
jgi:hypothetical protein